MYEIDFLPVENEDQDGGKSGDAIALRFTLGGGYDQVVVVIDGGFRAVGDDLVDHIRKYYRTQRVDLVLSTHPDVDHLNGLQTVLEELSVGELMIHRPRNHGIDIRDFSNIEAVDDLLKLANQRGIRVTEPFAGVTRFGGRVRILGPTREYYCSLLAEQLTLKSALMRALEASASRRLFSQAGDLLERILRFLPLETLTDEGTTSERNNSSAICLVTTDDRRLMFTGDAGIPALTAAAGNYEHHVGPFSTTPLHLFQAPHHGSRRNVGPTILNRILGRPGAAHSDDCTAVASSAKASEKHPSPKVINALTRRNCRVYATEGNSLLIPYNSPDRGWPTVQPFPPLFETDGDT